MQKNISKFDKIFPLLFRTFWVVLMLLIIFSTSYSCKNYDVANEIRQTDTLLSWLTTTSNFMIIEEDWIEKRIDSMQQRISFIEILDTLKMTDEFRFDYASYRAMVKNYQRFSDNYSLTKYNQSAYRMRVDKLKKELIDRKTGKENFVKEYAKLHEQIKAHLLETRTIVKEVISYEKMYQRINNKIIKFYNKGSYKNTELTAP